MSLSGEALLDALEAGSVRVAAPEPDQAGRWRVHAWVKEEILALFRESPNAPHGTDREVWPFVDKEAFRVRGFAPEAGIRVVPGGTSVRRGSYVGSRCVLMPPSYVNVGAYVGADTMIDSHVLIGSCAQIGERVHVSAGVQIGGVLEPIGSRPVIVEDDVVVGGQCGLYEGVLVRRGAVLAAGVVLTASTPVFDVVHERELRGDRSEPVVVPENAVVVPGTRPASGDWARERSLGLACAVIVKYRDERTDAATAREEALR